MSLTSCEKTKTNTYELVVSVGAEEFQGAIEKAYRKNVSKISIPGFRKGKAPKAMIEKMYGEGVFYEDAINMLYPDAYEQAVKEAGIEPVAAPSIEVQDADKTTGFTFKAEVTVKPEVEVENYKGIAVTKTVRPVTDEEIDHELSHLQERNARVIDVEDRPAQDGDQTVIDFEGFVDGVAFEGGKGEKFPLTLGSGQFIPGFEEQIVGKKIGDEFDVTVTFPEDYHAEELKGKEAVFKVKLHEIKTRELPELDDEFAKDVSEFDTLAEYKEDLRKKLQASHDEQSDREVESALIDGILAGMKVELPQAMIDNRVDEMLQDFAYRLQSQGLDVKTYMQYTGMDMDAMRKTYAEPAERQVKVRLALEKIAQLENLAATQEELDAEYKKLADSYQMEEDKIKAVIAAEDLEKDICVNKAIALVRENAVITEAQPEEKAEPKKKAAKKPAAKKTTKKAAKEEGPAEEAPAAAEETPAQE